MMEDYNYRQDIKETLTDSAFTKSNGVFDTLLSNDINYPYISSLIQIDSVTFSNIKLTDGDVEKMTSDDHKFEVFDDRIEHNGKKVGKYNDNTKKVSIIGNRNKRNPLVLWLAENSFLNSDTAYKVFRDSVDLDSVKSDNFLGLRKELIKVSKKISQKSKKGMKPETAFLQHLGFSSLVKGTAVKYTPMSIELEDGQVLIGLARQYGDNAKKSDKQEPYDVTKWFLNHQDITKTVFMKGKPKDLNELAHRLVNHVQASHAKFLKNNPEIAEDNKAVEKEIEALTAEINEMDIDLVGESADYDYNEEVKQKQDEIERLAILADKKGLSVFARPSFEVDIVTKAPESKMLKENASIFKPENMKPEWMSMEDILEYERKMKEDKNTEITAENIAEFYPTMSDEELERYSKLIRPILSKRSDKIAKEILFDIPSDMYEKMELYKKYSNTNFISTTFWFGIKDNLQPIEEYIAEIKASDAYKDYVSSRYEEDATFTFDGKNANLIEEKINSIDGYEANIEENGKLTINEEIVFKEDKVIIRDDKIFIFSLSKQSERLVSPYEQKEDLTAKVTALANAEVESGEYNPASMNQGMMDISKGREAGDAEYTELLELYSGILQDGRDAQAKKILDAEAEKAKTIEDEREKTVEQEELERQSAKVSFDDKISELETITNSDELENALDTLVEEIEASGDIEKYEEKLGQIADKITELMQSENS